MLNDQVVSALRAAFIVLAIGLIVASAPSPAVAQAPFSSLPIGSQAGESVSPLTRPINDFGFKVLRALATESPNTNICVSPVSLHIGLDMLRCGATGAAADRLSTALGISSLSTTNLQRDVVNFRAGFTGQQPSHQLEIANGLWVDSNIPVLPDYVDICKVNFGADVTEASLAGSDISGQLTKWVSDNSGGLITGPAEHVDATTAVLESELNLSGNWLNPFADNLTAEMPFHQVGGKPDVLAFQMDQTTRSSWYYEDTNVQVAEITAVTGGGFNSFVVVMPKEIDGLRDILTSMNGDTWDRWVGHTVSSSGELALPRFKVATNCSMNAVLEMLGIPLSQFHGADFTPITGKAGDFHLDSVEFHGAINLAERGINIPQSANSFGSFGSQFGGYNGSGTAQKTPFHMIVDRPFFFAIVDHNTGVIALEGLVYNPGQPKPETPATAGMPHSGYRSSIGGFIGGF